VRKQADYVLECEAEFAISYIYRCYTLLWGWGELDGYMCVYMWMKMKMKMKVYGEWDADVLVWKETVRWSIYLCLYL
jgi:hypothetical protein